MTPSVPVLAATGSPVGRSSESHWRAPSCRTRRSWFWMRRPVRWTTTPSGPCGRRRGQQDQTGTHDLSDHRLGLSTVGDADPHRRVRPRPPDRARAPRSTPWPWAAGTRPWCTPKGRGLRTRTSTPRTVKASRQPEGTGTSLLWIQPDVTPVHENHARRPSPAREGSGAVGGSASSRRHATRSGERFRHRESADLAAALVDQPWPVGQRPFAHTAGARVEDDEKIGRLVLTWTCAVDAQVSGVQGRLDRRDRLIESHSGAFPDDAHRRRGRATLPSDGAGSAALFDRATQRTRFWGA